MRCKPRFSLKAGDLLHQERVLGVGVLTTPQSASPANDLSDTSSDHCWEQPPRPGTERLAKVSSYQAIR